jgi:hypothetical protein
MNVREEPARIELRVIEREIGTLLRYKRVRTITIVDFAERAEIVPGFMIIYFRLLLNFENIPIQEIICVQQTEKMQCLFL